jgi:hypothetical protein
MKKLWIVKMILLVIASVIAMAAIVMWLWNWLVPDLFNGPMINFYQSLGLMLLSRILFRGFHGMKNREMQCRTWGGGWKDRFEKMDPEQREKIREMWKKRCGGFKCDDEKPS